MRPEAESADRRRTRCRVCGADLVPEQRFCGECGVDLGLDRMLHDEAGDLEPPRAAADPLVGRTLAERYRILRCIGRGGMGVVYEVEHIHIGKRLAMKLLHGELAGDPATLRRLRREAETASRLSDSGTVQVFDFGQSEGLAYLVMELVDGEDLGQLLRREGKQPFARIARLLLDVCGSLAEAHAVGVVHRDLKPENVMITRTPGGTKAKVLDFGLAVLRAAPGGSASRSGSIVGTPYYMAPEQIRGEAVDGRADVYALGGLMYRAVVGAPPFKGDSAIVVLTQHLTDTPRPPSRAGADVDAAAERIILRCLEKRASDRYPTALALREDLEAWLRGQGESFSLHSLVPPRSREEAFATRQDIDGYEARLRRRSRLTVVGFVSILGGLVVAAIALGSQVAGSTVLPTTELEPNQTMLTATRLAPGRELTAQLGRRIDRERGDVDLYRLVMPPGGARALRAIVTPLPNVDLVLELFRAGETEPLISVDAHEVGEGESFVGFPIRPGEHLLAVREHWKAGQYPTENVSDWYRIRWDPVPSDDGELDDDPVTARTLVPGVPLEGRIGWPGDVDVACMNAPLRASRLAITAEAGLDARLAILDDADHEGIAADAARSGGGETLELPALANGRVCVAVTASSAPEAGPLDPRASRYRLLLVEP